MLYEVITVNGWIEEKRILLTVTDDGKGMDKENVVSEKPGGSHYGMRNIDRITSYNVCYTKLLRILTLRLLCTGIIQSILLFIQADITTIPHTRHCVQPFCDLS